MVYEIDASVQRGTYIKKEVKNVPRHFSKAATSQYKKFSLQKGNRDILY